MRQGELGLLPSINDSEIKVVIMGWLQFQQLPGILSLLKLRNQHRLQDLSGSATYILGYLLDKLRRPKPRAIEFHEFIDALEEVAGDNAQPLNSEIDAKLIPNLYVVYIDNYNCRSWLHGQPIELTEKKIHYEFGRMMASHNWRPQDKDFWVLLKQHPDDIRLEVKAAFYQPQVTVQASTGQSRKLGPGERMRVGKKIPSDLEFSDDGSISDNQCQVRVWRQLPKEDMQEPPKTNVFLVDGKPTDVGLGPDGEIAEEISVNPSASGTYLRGYRVSESTPLNGNMVKVTFQPNEQGHFFTVSIQQRPSPLEWCEQAQKDH